MLVVGKKYRVTMEDCCVNICVTGTLISVKDDDDDWPSPTTEWDFGTLKGQFSETTLID